MFPDFYSVNLGFIVEEAADGPPVAALGYAAGFEGAALGLTIPFAPAP